MAENQPVSENTGDDLNLVSLVERIFTFFKNYGLLIIIFSICGMVLGYTSYKSSPKLYASTLLLHSFTFTNAEQINIIENWNAMLKNGEYEILSKRLNCDPVSLKKVADISATELQKNYTSNNYNGFTVNVFVKDNAILDSLQQGIIFGLENSGYIKAKLISKRENLLQLIESVKKQIIELDSLKKNIEHSINNNIQRSPSFVVDVSAINSEVVGLNEKLLDYQDQLKFSNAVQVFHGFEKFQQPVAPKFLKSIVLGFLGGFAVGYVLSIFLYVRKRFRYRIK